MKKVFIALCITVLALSAGLQSAEARRMGGGGSFGKQSQKASRPAPAQNQAVTPAKPAATTAPTTPATAKPSPWKGLLGGALLGLGLGSLLSGMGLGGALASMISTMLTFGLIAMAGLLAYRWYKRRSEDASATNPAFANAATTFPANLFPQRSDNRFGAAQAAAMQPTSNTSAITIGSGQQGTGTASGEPIHTADAGPWGVPADFDTQGFLRHSKGYFIRLQAAWDKADVNDISEFTTPEMFAEIKLQIQERGAAANHTDVMALDAELLGIDTVNSDYLASVKFSGMIKEDSNTPTAAFSEVWNLSKPITGRGGWTLAGIQQHEAA